MKNKLHFFLASAITFCLTFLSAAPVSAYDFKVDGVYYNITSSSDLTCCVTSNGNGSYSGDVVIPEQVSYDGQTYSVTSIRRYAFYRCSSLTSVSIPNSVTEIGNAAFMSCTNLSTITIPSSVTEIADTLFWGSGLTSIEIPNSVTSIGVRAFTTCTKLASVTIGNSVESIGRAAFYGCTGLTSITIPSSVTSVSKSAFRMCTGLTSVTIENSVIGETQFQECTSLTSIIIPSSVTSIGDQAFVDCTALKSITSLATTPPTAGDVIFSTSTYENATISVPEGSAILYAYATGWKNFKYEGVEMAIHDVTIDQNGATTIFDIQGHKLAQPKSGINIINGKKVLVK